MALGYAIHADGALVIFTSLLSFFFLKNTYESGPF